MGRVLAIPRLSARGDDQVAGGGTRSGVQRPSRAGSQLDPGQCDRAGGRCLASPEGWSSNRGRPRQRSRSASRVRLRWRTRTGWTRFARLFGPDGKIRVDVNAGWDLDTATERLATFSKFGLEYAEQPVATLEEMIELKKRTDVPLAADELVRLRPDPLEVAASGAADLVVIKVQPLGGVTRALDIAARAGVPVVVSSALETSVGIYTGLLVASLLPDLPYACGLGHRGLDRR